jgi:hypothetical protein
MVKLSNFTYVILPLADHMATSVNDSLNYHLNTANGRTGLHDLHSTLDAAGIDASGIPSEAILTTDGHDGVSAIAMGNEAASFTDTREVVLSLTSPHLYAKTLVKITIHLMPDPINPRFHRIYRVPQPALDEGEVLPSSISNTHKPLSTAPTSRPA